MLLQSVVLEYIFIKLMVKWSEGLCSIIIFVFGGGTAVLVVNMMIRNNSVVEYSGSSLLLV